MSAVKMGQKRLSSVAVFAIERDLTLDYDDIVTKFSLFQTLRSRV
jgi:hypothetical protein